MVRVGAGPKGLALTTDCTPRYCRADPETGGAQAVAESWRNLTAVGARPLAVTDNMNFGNPERPEIMGQFVGCIEGMREACLALDYPVVSGNVSLYNETNGKGILPTPVIGGVGLVADVARIVSIAFKAEGEAIVLIGEKPRAISAARSICARSRGARKARRRRSISRPSGGIGDFVRGLIEAGELTACHDLSDGGLLVALAEMAMAGRIGAEIDLAPGHPDPWLLVRRGPGALSRDPARGGARRLARGGRARRACRPSRSGRTGGDALTLQGGGPYR